MSIDYSVLSIPKGTPRVLVTETKRQQADSLLEKAYAEVDKRDGKKCRVRCNRLIPGAADKWQRLERHHLDERSTHPERKYDVDNILTTSAGVHQLMGAHALIPVDKAGEETTYVSRIVGYRWNERHVKPGKAPFRLKEIAR